jgi:hypothetical protein
VVLTRWLSGFVLLVACSGGKSKAVEDAKSAPRPADAPPVAPAVVHGYRVDTAAKTGDVKITVEWKDTPQVLRAPGPPTKCGTPRTPAVAPATLWGIPDVLVIVDVDHGRAFTPPSARLVVEDCDFAPRAVVAGPTVLLASAMLEPVAVTLQALARPLAGAAIAGTKPRTIYLPIAGHEVEAALEPDTVYAVAFGTDDIAAVVSATSPYVAVTEAAGAVTMRDVPVGTHPVRAYLPARNGGDARTTQGTITVTEGNLAEITLDISRP